MVIYGYIRVSTREQNEVRQLNALGGWGILPENLFTDKQSGKDFERPGWLDLMGRLDRGDLLVVQSIDRLGRNYTEILEWWRYITKDRQADIVVLDMPLLDTRAKGEDLTGAFVADLVLQILSYVAQAERENIRKRQAEGIAEAKKKGVRLGRPPTPLPENFQQVRLDWRSKKLTLQQAADACSMPVATFYAKAVRAEHSA